MMARVALMWYNKDGKVQYCMCYSTICVRCFRKSHVSNSNIDESALFMQQTDIVYGYGLECKLTHVQ